MSDFISTKIIIIEARSKKFIVEVSQFKEFVGTYGRPSCEYRALESLNGRWKEEDSTALLVGSFVDAFWEGSLERFKDEHPDIFTKSGELKAPYRQAETIIERTLRQEILPIYEWRKRR